MNDLLSITKDISVNSEVFIRDSVLESGSKEASLPFQQEPTDVPAVYLLLVSMLPERSSSANTPWETHGQKPYEGFHLKLNEYEMKKYKMYLNDGSNPPFTFNNVPPLNSFKSFKYISLIWSFLS